MTVPIGLALRAARKSRKMTQAELAKRSGVDRIYISQIENGRFTPRLERVEELSTAMKLSISQIFLQAELIAETNVVPHNPSA
jgi:transcriptional regulator with XRE-family HTH domain